MSIKVRTHNHPNPKTNEQPIQPVHVS